MGGAAWLHATWHVSKVAVPVVPACTVYNGGAVSRPGGGQQRSNVIIGIIAAFYWASYLPASSRNAELIFPHPPVMPSFLHCNQPRCGEQCPWEQQLCNHGWIFSQKSPKIRYFFLPPPCRKGRISTHVCNSAYYPHKTNATTCQPHSINRKNSDLRQLGCMDIVAQMKELAKGLT